MNQHHHAVSYEFPKPPAIVRFDTPEDCNAFVEASPATRRHIDPPPSPDGFHPGRWSGLTGEFRFATIDDLAP